MAAVRPVLKAYQAANGKEPSAILDVLPYATTSEQAAIIRNMAQRESADCDMSGDFVDLDQGYTAAAVLAVILVGFRPGAP